MSSRESIERGSKGDRSWQCRGNSSIIVKGKTWQGY